MKKFVYNKPTIMLKQLEEAFNGNPHLEKILQPDETGARCLDWRLLMTPGLFVELPEGDEEDRDLDSMEEDPELAFKVDALMLLGILYCRTSPRTRIKKFYSML